MSKRRVVITGIGAVTPIGKDINESWNNLINSKSGIKKISNFDPEGFSCKIAAEVKLDKEFITQFIEIKEQRKVDEFTTLAIIAATQAINDSGYKAETDSQKFRSGVLIGSGIGGLKSIEKTVEIVNHKSPKKVSPFFIPSSLINIASGHVSIKYGFMGPNHSVVTACATGTHAIGDSFKLIQDNRADVMICGGAESVVCKTAIAGFSALRALSTNFNEDPESASRPFDATRDGFVLGEGAGALVLEDYDHAKARGAKIYAEVIGGGMSSDAYHMTAPHPEGIGVERVMHNCLNDAGIQAGEVDAINTHGTSTPLGDVAELKAISKVFGAHANKININSTKSMTGHSLGATGAQEAIYSIMMINEGFIAPSINITNLVDEANGLNINQETREQKLDNVMSNSFGFGGTNATLILSRY